jgi:hypothetical protein
VITRLVQNTIRRERFDLDALETSLRASMHQIGAKALVDNLASRYRVLPPGL